MNNYFEDKEFYCPHCKKHLMQPDMIDMLNQAREILGESIVLTSAWRCREHNHKVGGVDSSSHVNGWAVDIKCTNSRYRYNLINALTKVGFNRFGVGKQFVHVDADPTKDKDVCWVY